MVERACHEGVDTRVGDALMANWNPWENDVIKHASGSFNKKQVANILTFLGSKRDSPAVARQASVLGWSLRVVK